jgi:hypothetical protein
MKNLVQEVWRIYVFFDMKWEMDWENRRAIGEVVDCVDDVLELLEEMGFEPDTNLLLNEWCREAKQKPLTYILPYIEKVKTRCREGGAFRLLHLMGRVEENIKTLIEEMKQ